MIGSLTVAPRAALVRPPRRAASTAVGLAGDDELAGAVVVRGPHAVDPGAELLDDGVLEPEHRGHRAGVLLRRLGRRLAARRGRARSRRGRRARRRPRAPSTRRPSGRRRRPAATPSVSTARRQAMRGRDERRLLQLGLRQLLDRALEAELRERRSPTASERLVVHRARLRERLGELAAHADALRALAGEAERDLTTAARAQVMYDEPQVSPPPTALIRTFIPGSQPALVERVGERRAESTPPTCCRSARCSRRPSPAGGRGA